MKFVQHASPGAFLASARDWLLEREAENNLVLGLAGARAEQAPADEPPAFFASVQEGDRVLGCAFRTPPLGLGLTRMPTGAIPLLAVHVARLYPTLPWVVGPPEPVEAFAGIWSDLQDVPWRRGMEMGIYAAEEVKPPAPPAPGRMRVATEDDLSQVTEWCHRFAEDTGIRGREADRLASELVEARAVFLWEVEGETVAMAAAQGETPNGIRVGYVYTPPELRGRRYATTLTAGLTRLLLDRGRRFCFLYTDLANPTSNGIYLRIGYRKVAEALQVHFEDPELAKPGPHR